MTFAYSMLYLQKAQSGDFRLATIRKPEALGPQAKAETGRDTRQVSLQSVCYLRQQGRSWEGEGTFITAGQMGGSGGGETWRMNACCWTLITDC